MALTKITSRTIEPGSISSNSLSQDVVETISSAAGGVSPVIANVQIANSTYGVLDDTAVSLDGGYIILNGNNFGSNTQLVIGDTLASSITVVSNTVIRAQVPAKTAGSYILYLTNQETGSVAIRVNGLTYSGTPTWVTGSTLPQGGVDEAISIQLSATADSNVSYQLQTGSSLPAGLSLAANGLLTGTVAGIEDETTYNFIVEAIDAENQESPRSFSITITAGDEYFYATTLLLNGDGTNGANNNTFVDSSTNNLAITRNGNVAQGTFSPFSAPDGGWSAYFDGSGDYLSIAQNSAFNFGTGAFTVEGWFYFWGSFGSVYNGLINLGNGASGAGIFTGWGLITGGTGTEIRWYRFDGTETQYIGNFSFQVGTWYHIAACRNSSSNLAVFVNGTRVISATSSLSFNNVNSDPLNIGYRNDGVSGITHAKIYSSNIRIVAGSAVYDPTQSSISVPTSPLTAITNTSLLTCQSNRFKDNSTNNFTITRNGDVKVTSFSPFAPTGIYSTATNGGSGYFDGSGDYLSVADNASLEVLSDNFTLEGWFYATGGSSNVDNVIISKTSSAYAPYWVSYRGTLGHVAFCSSSTNGSWNIANNVAFGNVTLNTWHHFAICRLGTNIYCFLNGVLGATVSVSTNVLHDNSSPVNIAAQFNGGNPFLGYISSVRLVVGTAVYTSAFTPPTAPLTAITNTSLLLNFTNGGIIDYTGKNNLETVGNAQISTSVKKYGTGSMYFDGTGDYLADTVNPQYFFGTGDFTVECWVNPTTLNSYNMIFGYGSPNNYWSIVNTGFLQFYDGTTPFEASNGAVLTGQWTHIAISRQGTTLRQFVNGTQVLSSTCATSLGAASGTSIWFGASAAYTTQHFFTGYIDDFRITKGVARYTTNFTPPDSAHRLR